MRFHNNHVLFSKDSSQKRKSIIEANSKQGSSTASNPTKPRQLAVVKPLNSKQKDKNQKQVKDEEKPREIVKFKSPTRGYNRKHKIKRKLNYFY